MQIRKGRDHIVFVFPEIKIVIKIPIIRFFQAIHLLYYHIKNNKWGLLKKQWDLPIEKFNGFKGLLFRGLAVNWSEFQFYRQTHNPFLQPTYFSIGFFNIQRADEPCLLKEDDLWCQLYGLTSGDVFNDSHHFDNPHNFCFYNGKLRILDYGSRMSHGVITRHGAKIVEFFNPAYCWEEEKRKLREK